MFPIYCHRELCVRNIHTCTPHTRISLCTLPLHDVIVFYMLFSVFVKLINIQTLIFIIKSVIITTGHSIYLCSHEHCWRRIYNVTFNVFYSPQHMETNMCQFSFASSYCFITRGLTINTELSTNYSLTEQRNCKLQHLIP